MDAPKIDSTDRDERIEAKIDLLLKNNVDEQVAGLLGKVNGFLAHPIVGRVFVPLGIVIALGWAGKNGYLTPDQQTKAAEVVIAAAAPGSAPGVLAPQPVPVPVVVEPVAQAPVEVIVVPAPSTPAPMVPTE